MEAAEERMWHKALQLDEAGDDDGQDQCDNEESN
jgi:hypothetical protein